MSKNATQFDKFFKETSDFGANYSEACTKSGAIFAKGLEDIVSTMVSLAQQSAEKQSAFFKEAMKCKNINDFAETQSKLAQSSFDDFMNGATKISEISVKMLSESVEPVSSQITQTVEKATQAMAA